MILEIGKKYINNFYNGDIKRAIKNNDGILHTNEHIKNAFNCGNGTTKDQKKYIENNKEYAYFIEV